MLKKKNTQEAALGKHFCMIATTLITSSQHKRVTCHLGGKGFLKHRTIVLFQSSSPAVKG